MFIFYFVIDFIPVWGWMGSVEMKKTKQKVFERVFEGGVSDLS